MTFLPSLLLCPGVRVLRRARMCQLAAVLGLAWLAGGSAWAQGGIYTCVDAQGRRLTSDRPILACIDREQRELGSSGNTRRVIPPTMTAAERAAIQAREREEAMQRQREQDLVRRDQALVMRYPNPAAHEEGRRAALAQSQVVLDAAERRLNELASERKKLDEEMEFYSKNPSQAPAKLRLGIQANTRAVQDQKRVIDGQQGERNRINAHFDKEAERLRSLWQARDKTEAAAQP
ncbi:MAG: DUF4124 domain-containing protein [Pseudomonadota bacterium]|nr:DUF4124 domain-containing protein [Pseudomonadota bacterium]